MTHTSLAEYIATLIGSDGVARALRAGHDAGGILDVRPVPPILGTPSKAAGHALRFDVWSVFGRSRLCDTARDALSEAGFVPGISSTLKHYATLQYDLPLSESMRLELERAFEAGRKRSLLETVGQLETAEKLWDRLQSLRDGYSVSILFEEEHVRQTRDHHALECLLSSLSRNLYTMLAFSRKDDEPCAETQRVRISRTRRNQYSVRLERHASIAVGNEQSSVVIRTCAESPRRTVLAKLDVEVG